MSLPCFNYYYELFDQNKKKIIPKEILGLLTIISLSYWIMEGFRLLILYSLNENGPEYTNYLSGIPCIGVNYAGKVTPEIYYLNADKDKEEIYNENKKKSEVYCWTNLTNGRSYVGSSENLSKRISWYYSFNRINKLASKSLISRAL